MRTSAVLVATSLLVAGLSTTPSYAASERTADATRDVNVRKNATVDRRTTRAPWADITRFRTTYAARKLVLRLTIAEPLTKRDHTMYVAVAIETIDPVERTTDTYVATVVRSMSTPVGDVHLSGSDPDQAEKCATTWTTLRENRARTRLTIETPARCVGAAGSLRTAAQVRVVKGDGSKVQWHDDARAGHRVPGASGAYETPTYGPEVARG